MLKKNFKKLTIALLACLTFIGAFAWLSDSAVSNKTSNITVADIGIEFVNEVNTITLTANDSVPMTEEWAKENLTPFTFQLRNVGNSDLSYEVIIKDLTSSFPEGKVMVLSSEIGNEVSAANELSLYTGTLLAGETSSVKTLLTYLNEDLLLEDYTNMAASFTLEVRANQNNSISELPTKGDLITIKGAQYRVLSLNGTNAKVLAMSDVTRIEFNDSSITTSFNGTDGQKYEGSKLDNYLENTWYAGLPQTMKDAIVPQDIKQNMFEFDVTPADLSSWYKYGFAESDTSENAEMVYTLSKIGSVSVGSRHVYALDVQDVIDYLGLEFDPQDLNDMFWQQRSTNSGYIWLRSAIADDADYAFYVYGFYGRVDNDDCTFDDDVRPAFVIDLSKIDWMFYSE